MSARTAATEDLVSYAEFYRRIADGQKADLIDGVIYVASPESRKGSRIGGFLNMLMFGYVEAKELGGEVHGSRFAYRITKYRAPEPDCSYVRAERLHLITEREMRGAPDVAAEIVSRDSVRRDYHDKKNLYEEAGVTEYWLIDPLREKVFFYRLTRGKYRLVPLDKEGRFHSKVLPGFWLDPTWLLAKPLPNGYACLQRILSGD